MQRAVRWCSFVFVTLIVSACAQLSQMQSAGSVAGKHDPLEGSVLELTQALSVPEGANKAWFDPVFYQTQSLSLTGLLGPNRLRDGIKCGLRLSRSVASSGAAVVVEPDKFVIESVSRLSDPYGIDPATVSSHDGFDSDVTLTYRIRVTSTAQPQVDDIFCSQRHASLARGTHFPSASELREQAGEQLIWPSSVVE